MNARIKSRRLTTATAIAAMLAATTLAACNKADDSRTAGERLDSATATAQRNMDQAQTEAKQAGGDIKNDAKQAATEVKTTISDATITASVNAKLAADKELSALRINVDTADGRVALNGTAPNSAARERATQIAAAVEGVRSVDNRLQLAAS
jgi:hyperosmotically inducible periplasmic protein